MPDVRFRSRMATIIGGLRGAALRAVEEAGAAVVQAANIAAARAKDLTPRSDLARSHLADGWEVVVKAEGAKVTATVRNKETRGNDPIKLLSGQETTLLHVLEYGSAAHEIRAKAGKYLVFFWFGEWVAAKKVLHPGTKAYSMLALARVSAEVDLKRSLDRIRRTVRLALKGRVPI